MTNAQRLKDQAGVNNYSQKKTTYKTIMYSIEKTATLTGARRYGTAERRVGFLLTDSRSLSFPEETLFFAIKSQRNDGHCYIDDLYRRGVRAFAVEHLPEDYDTRYPDAVFLKAKTDSSSVSDMMPIRSLSKAKISICAARS